MSQIRTMNVWGLNVDRFGRTMRAIVLARSMTAAARYFGVTVYTLGKFGSITGNVREISAAYAAGEGNVLFRVADLWDAEFVGDERLEEIANRGRQISLDLAAGEGDQS
jgi:hypothetical protein